MQAKRILCRGLAVVLALALSVTALAAALYLLATSQPVMLSLLERYAPPERTFLPASEYPAMADMITAYLRGERESFQLAYTMAGSEFLAFHDYEQQHMADCLALFELCRTILLAGAAASAVLAAALAMLRDDSCRRWLAGGLIAVLALVGVVAVMAAVDFDGLFILFHQVAFTNDLWLLNPYTDMLIRLMPTNFFVTYVSLIGIAWLGMMLVMLPAVILLKRLFQRNEPS